MLNTCENVMEEYLNKPLHQTVIIQHAKVAQKSYGSEKRFFCPPPCIYFSGNGWKVKEDTESEQRNTSSTTENNTKEDKKEKNEGRGEASAHICAYMSINCISKDSVHMTLETNNFCAAKTLYISDSDKSKYFRLTTNLFYSDGQAIGTFHGQHIKVISKPSKKKQSLKNADLCIESGTKIALFNRLRSQTVSTRYLHVQDGEFQASSMHWGAFEINLVSKDTKEGDSFIEEAGFIHYGATVKLVCSVSNVALPLMVIHKVDKQSVLLEAEEPVSQLHKCALRFKNAPCQEHSYLCLSQEKIIQYQASTTSNSNGDSREVISDGATWTIISTESLKYSFSNAYSSTDLPVTPVPVVNHMTINGSGSSSMLSLSGFNFTPNIKVCFATVEADTSFRCEESLMCRVPDKSKLPSLGRHMKVINETHFEVAIFLVRSDGVIYPTELTYTYDTQSLSPSVVPAYPSIRYIHPDPHIHLYQPLITPQFCIRMA